ncbi:MAG: serine hydrolase [Roseiarcus sp.]|jgi:CubicO group peptidase (beta-lactamase class C family)
MRLRTAGAALLLAGAIVAAGSSAAAAAPAAATIWPTEGWAASAPEDQGMDSAALARLVEAVGGSRQDSLLIVRHGRIVVEAYYAPFAADIRHDLRSVTKSVIGTLTAIAIREGLLDSVDHPILDLFADKDIGAVDERKKAITVQHLLDMTSGLDWREQAYTPDETLAQMYLSADRAAFVLGRPMASAPGAQFNYDSGNPYVLSALITRKTGRSAFEFAKTRLFEPLGIARARWGGVDAQGVTDGESGLFLTPRDMAKIGYLYLHDGVWDGRPIIPVSWVARARAGVIDATYGFRYANLWWSLPEKGALMARGRHSQLILVLPGLDVVAAMTGVLRDDDYYPTDRLIDAIAGAVRSDGPIAADSVARSLLAAAIRQAATETPSPVGETPALAEAISDRVYRIADNALHVKTVSLRLVGPNPSWEITTQSGSPDAPPERFAGLIGLDGMFRTGPPASYGVDAVKGRWLSARTFSAERRILGHAEIQTWTLTFDGRAVAIDFETTDGFKTQLRGEQSD